MADDPELAAAKAAELKLRVESVMEVFNSIPEDGMKIGDLSNKLMYFVPWKGDRYHRFYSFEEAQMIVKALLKAGETPVLEGSEQRMADEHRKLAAAGVLRYEGDVIFLERAPTHDDLRDFFTRYA